mmetsp:Transcript_8798/g.8870  ORF Transcript_8798/g.8870 Transcript_8798/m.8870 type:complete len:236 (-) Transcript_8798:12-719(-)
MLKIFLKLVIPLASIMLDKADGSSASKGMIGIHHSTALSSNVLSEPRNPAIICKSQTSVSRKPYSKRFQKFIAAWGAFGVISILANAIKRLYPIAIQPFLQKDLTATHWIITSIWTIFMMYTEGYKAFHCKFSPLVVRRAFTLVEHPSMLNYILAGPYCMGLFSATKKRMITSWSITAGVFVIVAVVKKLPYPWRSIVDMGVVAGLSYGALSIGYQFVRALFGKIPEVDPCLPVS